MLAQPGGASSVGSGSENQGAAAATAAASPTEQIENLPSLLVTREITEHANVFHSMTGELMGCRDAHRPCRRAVPLPVQPIKPASRSMACLC
jgi:hypothetical protein